MRMWLKALVLGSASLAMTLPAAAETLADALTAAYRNSHLLDQNEAVLRAADEDVAVAVSSLRPVVSYVVNWGKSYANYTTAGVHVSGDTLATSVSLSLDLMVFDFGRTKAQIAIAEESVKATRQALVGVEQDVLLAAVQAYVDVKLAEEIVALRQSNVRLITQELRAAQDRFEVGEITRTDVSIAEARLAASRASLAAAEGTLMVARESYKAATGAYPGRLAALPPSPKIGKTIDEARSVAMKTHPAIRQAQHQVTIADRSVELAEASMKPSIGLGVSISNTTVQDRFSADAGLQMSQTLYAGGKLSALYRKSLAQKEAARSGLKQTVVLIEQNLGNAWANLAVYGASIKATTAQIEAAQSAFDGVREEASLGARTTLDVLDAEQELLDARASRLEAEANRYVAVYRVLAAMGLLTVDHLKLGIPTYDPDAYYDAVKRAPATSSRGKKLDAIMEKVGR
ncbi:TolC family outer membrane protein [Fuscovulum blasticum]|uniref:TolC family outer membrane protein n=1 Tax=Fuscovulum blasticum TaxID=1075 RepID=UPI000D3E08AF|nr:TolC family outer membrane protein [Fuscovulum blasticum]AWD20273.1 transporter [Fuscovulum blasticum]